MTKEYIERGALLELETFLQDADGFDCSAVLSVDIRHAKAADVVEVKHGRWLYSDGYNTCSVCRGEVAEYNDCGCAQWFYYCPNCGARMDGGADK